jgi:hypothetical protein
MQPIDWSTPFTLVGLVVLIGCLVRAGRVRDPRDADGRRLPRTGDEEGRARRIARVGLIVCMACAGTGIVVGAIAEPESLPLLGVWLALGALVALIVLVVRRRRRASSGDT